MLELPLCTKQATLWRGLQLAEQAEPSQCCPVEAAAALLSMLNSLFHAPHRPSHGGGQSLLRLHRRSTDRRRQQVAAKLCPHLVRHLHPAEVQTLQPQPWLLQAGSDCCQPVSQATPGDAQVPEARPCTQQQCRFPTCCQVAGDAPVPEACAPACSSWPSLASWPCACHRATHLQCAAK